ncbi:MAG: OmpA family protein [Spirochaetota bacterium]
MRNVLICFAAALAALSCSSAKIQQKPEKVSSSASADWIARCNSDLTKHTLYDFSYKDAALPDREFQKWIAASFPAVSGITSSLPSGYVLQVTGHSDASGPEYPEGNRPGNLRISQDRAARVRDALVAEGISPSKLTAKGAGTSELLKKYPAKSKYQRRVTFKAVPEK